MIVGLDSSFDVPTRAQARAARAAGVRVWGGYFGSRDGLGLAVRWSREQFAVLQEEDITPLGFCSGWDSPDWIRETAAAWGIRPCVDVEPGIRDEFEGGIWVPDWLDRSGAGIYGLAHTVRGYRAAFVVVARYPPLGCTGATWDAAAGAKPDCPTGWQCQGTHDEFGLSVDRGNYDDWFMREVYDVAQLDDMQAQLARIETQGQLTGDRLNWTFQRVDALLTTVPATLTAIKAELDQVLADQQGPNGDQPADLTKVYAELDRGIGELEALAKHLGADLTPPAAG